MDRSVGREGAKALAGLMMLGTVVLAGRPAMAASESDFRLDTARNLVNLCEAPPNDAFYAEARQFCYGYIAGAAQFYLAMLHSGAIRPIACPAAEMTRQQLASLFVDWSKSNEQHLDEQPVDALMRAAVAEWPCTK